MTWWKYVSSQEEGSRAKPKTEPHAHWPTASCLHISLLVAQDLNPHPSQEVRCETLSCRKVSIFDQEKNKPTSCPSQVSILSLELQNHSHSPQPLNIFARCKVERVQQERFLLDGLYSLVFSVFSMGLQVLLPSGEEGF